MAVEFRTLQIGNIMAKAGDLLSGNTGGKMKLTDALRQTVEVIDVTGNKPIQAPQARRAQGAPQPKRTQGAKKGKSMFSKVGDALMSPAGQNFLGSMGVAFTQGNPNSVGTILGTKGQELAQGRAIKNYASRLLKGEDPGDIEGMDVSNITPEGIAMAESMAARQEQGERADRGLDLESERVALQQKAMDLRERGLDIDQDIFEFDQETTTTELALTSRELDIKESMYQVDETLAQARADQVEIENNLLRGADKGGLTPEDQEALFENSKDFVSSVQSQVEPLEGQIGEERAILRSMKRDSNTTQGEIARQQGIVDSLDQTLSQLREAQFSAFQNMAERISVDLEDIPKDEEGNLDTSEMEPEEAQKANWWQQIKTEFQELFGMSKAGQALIPEEGSEEREIGTQDNPVIVPTNIETFADFQAELSKLNPGQYAEFNGTTFVINEDGEPEEVE